MPASILPTMSAPTSAPLVKMPPPSRANTEISEPPKLNPISASTACRVVSAAMTVGAPGGATHRAVHADVAGGRRQQSPDQEADRDADVLQRDQHDEDDHANRG